MSLKWSSLFTLINWYYTVMCFNSEKPCSGARFYGPTSYVCGVIGESIDLTCNVSTKCDRGFWKHDNNTNRMWLMPGKDVGPNYLFSYSPSQAPNSLRITNLSDSLSGIYTCLCDGNKQNKTAFACFNVSVQCYISVQINNENRIFDTCSVTRAVEMIAVKVNENISIRCGHNMKKNIHNCTQGAKRGSFTVDMSHDLCSVSCEPKEGLNGINCQAKWITLNVTDYRTLSSNKMSSYQTKPFSSFQTFSSVGPSEPNTRTTNKPSGVKTTGTPSSTNVTSVSTSLDHPVLSKTITTPKQTTKPISSKTTKLKNGENSAVFECSQLTTTFSKKANVTREILPSLETTSQEKVSKSLTTTVPIIVVACIVFVLSIIVLILCVHIIFYKKGIRSCNNKEEWVNPLYESADNRAELPIVLLDGGNVYNTINSPDDLTKFSSAEGASNNVHKIDLDLGRTNELPMVQLKASENVGIRVTPFGAHSMKFNKPRCKQTDTSLAAADEALNVPNVGDVSPPPASPHFYEMFK